MKIIAFYLPQFHPILENNTWWGNGFTEWHNVAKARPLFKGHIQPKLPGELGFYDLRLEETRIEQAALAHEYGIHGFCYWHYWFSGTRLLEQPSELLLKSKNISLPFCLAWANESWTGVWHGSPNKVLIEQKYSLEDAEAHYKLLRRYFCDDRYIKIKGSPLLYIYKPNLIPSQISYIDKLRELAKSDGYPGIHVLGTWSPNPRGRFNSLESVNLDGAVITNITGRDSHSNLVYLSSALEKLRHKLGKDIGPKKIDYLSAIESMLPSLNDFDFTAYNCVVSNWDNTPRSGRRGLVLTNSSPEKFEYALNIAKQNLKNRIKNNDEDFIFLKSWNEWAEGNYVEPDQHYGRQYLEAIKRTTEGQQ